MAKPHPDRDDKAARRAARHRALLACQATTWVPVELTAAEYAAAEAKGRQDIREIEASWSRECPVCGAPPGDKYCRDPAWPTSSNDDRYRVHRERKRIEPKPVGPQHHARRIT